MDDALTAKCERLHAILRGYGRLAVAFSGGVDSLFLLREAVRALGPGSVAALTARAPNFPADEDGEAARFCREAGVEQALVPVALMTLPGFADNPPDRCYHCKTELLARLRDAAAERGFTVIADGGNLDDLQDYRPGLRAVREAGVVSPLAEAGFAKADIRACLRAAGVSVWDKPAAACLASRIPYGTPITQDALARVEAAEAYLRSLGFAGVRVRHHGDLARIEVAEGAGGRLLEPETARAVAARLRELGYTFVCVDLLGYRTGSLNEVLKVE